MLRSALRRYIEQEVMPHVHRWVEKDFVPREVLRDLSARGFPGIRLGEVYGGSGMNVLGRVIPAEDPCRSSFGGFAITVLAQADMASPHRHLKGTSRG